MARCDHCGNDYDKPLAIEHGGKSHSFDCFECAIHVLAPECAACGVRIVGHGVEAEGRTFCCAHCAGAKGVTGVTDRV